MEKKTEPIYFAHSKENSSVEEWQRLEAHLLNVSEKAERFAKTFNNEDWVKTAGLLHDLGKYNPDFQTYLKKSNEACEETDEPNETPVKGLKKRAS